MTIALRISFVLLLLVSNVRAQLVTSTTQTPQQLVNNVLLGGGVNVSNITYTGSANAIGYFDGSNCNVGLNSGIVMTTGTVLATDGPHGPNNQAGAGTDNNQPGDPLLAAVTGNQSHNAAKLEFDFVPQSDSVSFNYVFGSEEYLEFVNAGVNDAFGFFISGPNPSGGNYVNENIALVPGTTTPITIDNVNSTVNSSYYIDNGDGSTAPQNSSNTFIQYDGLTTVLKAEAHLTCGETYHIVIVISDIGDGVLDSGVFLEAGSFTSPGVDISSELVFQGAVGNDSTLLEGCGGGTIWFSRTDSLAFQQSFNLSISGTATPGTDYSPLPSSITFLPGQDSVSVSITAFSDFVTEGIETFQINVSIPSDCGFPIEDSIVLYIQDVDSLDVSLTGDSVLCPGTNVTLVATPSGGTPNYTYLWNTGETTQAIHVSPTVTSSYWVEVTDTCGQVVSDSATVTVVIPQPLVANVMNDTTIHCPNSPVDLTASATGGYGGYGFQWNTGDTGTQISVQTPSTNTYVVTVTDQCGFTASDSAIVTVEEIPMSSWISNDTTICEGDSVQLAVYGIGGVGNDYDYLWSTGSSDSTIMVAPSSSTQYTVSISDGCGYIKAWDTVTVSVLQINANFVAPGPFEENMEIQFTNTSIGATDYEWDFGDGQQSIITHPAITYDSDGNYVVTLIAVNADNGCSDTISKVIEVKPEFFFYVPNAFTPDGDEFNNTFHAVGVGVAEHSYSMQIFNRWGERIFETNTVFGEWDGTYKGRLVEPGIYTYKIIVYNLRDEVKQIYGHVNLLR